MNNRKELPKSPRGVSIKRKRSSLLDLNKIASSRKAPKSEGIDKEGYVMIQEQREDNGRTKWSRRWFAAKGAVLKIYETKNSV